jgi:phosphoribosyl 1,2-cyclic phosphate phosphodiesterase
LQSLQVRFLGTGTSSGVPMIGCDCAVCQSQDPRDKRLRSSVLISTAATSLVVDTTPDFRYQMLRTGTRKLDAVLFTHPHKDHIAGLDDIRAFNFFSGKPMDIYAGSLTEEALRRDFYYAFSDTRYPGVPELRLHTIGTDAFMVGDIPVLPMEVWHMRMPVNGFRFGNFTYITDANRIEEDQRKLIRGSEILVLNALRKEKHISHFSLDEAVRVVEDLQVGRAYFTHISHQLGQHQDIEAELPAHMHLAYDGLQLEISLS